MAKKTRRARPIAPKSPARTSAAPGAPAAAAAVEQVRERSAVPQAAKKQVDFAAEYHYVIGDLRKMGILAAVMFTALIVLSFVIH